MKNNLGVKAVNPKCFLEKVAFKLGHEIRKIFTDIRGGGAGVSGLEKNTSKNKEANSACMENIVQGNFD